MQIDDRVTVTGPSAYRDDMPENVGKQFVIDQISKYGGLVVYSGKELSCWYAETSLELVEELAIGDVVEVIGQPKGVSGKPMGMKLPITTAFRDGSGWGYKVGEWWYPANRLRKIPKAEEMKLIDMRHPVMQELAAHKEHIDALETQLADLKEAFQEQDMHVTNMRDMHARNINKLRNRIHVLEEHDMYQAGVNDDIRSRLAFLEADHKTRMEMEAELERTSRFNQPEGQSLKVKLFARIPTEEELREILADLKPFPEPELKVGDWVRVVCYWPGPRYFKVAAINGALISDGLGSMHSRGLLHKLSDAEISERLNEGRA